MRCGTAILLTLTFLWTVTAVGASADTAQKYPDVVDVEVHAGQGGSFTFEVTLSSPYDSAERYADAFRIVTPDGETLGVRELLHHHANEQPFTRSLTGVRVPDDVRTVVVQGRDQEHGYGGQTIEVTLPER